MAGSPLLVRCCRPQTAPVELTMRKDRKEPLYRKENKLARHYPGNKGGDFRHIRNTKLMKEFDGTRMSMTSKRRGLDYTPLFRFLHSQVGTRWDEVYSEAVSRLDREEPISWIVVNDGRPIVCLGEQTYYHALFVDEHGILRFVDKSAPMPANYFICPCCTTTLDGVPIKKQDKQDPHSK
jgi:hypothetical protein